MFNVRDHFFFSQLHQPFFILAFVNAIVGMILFTPVFHGKLHSLLSSFTYGSFLGTSILFGLKPQKYNGVGFQDRFALS